MTRYFDWKRHSLLLTTACSLTLVGCLERELGVQGPRTTSLVSEQLNQAPPTKLDLLLVIDNSSSMADKQTVMAEAIPDLIRNLVQPPCVNEAGTRVAAEADGACPAGSNPEFEALGDIQVGVITTSLGGAGGESEYGCTYEAAADMAHLLPTRPRAAHVPSDGGVLAWKSGQDLDGFIDNVGELVTLAGENGCGEEATLEAWYRFLIDPAPYTQLVRANCDASDQNRSCTVRKPGADGTPEVDTELLAQRAKFLRDGSLVAVAMLSDENDCSIRENSKSWTLEDQVVMWRGSAACETDPNAACCQPCLANKVPSECPTEAGTTPDGNPGQVPLGCGAGNFHEYEDDQPNLRCFDQKRRFGVDLLQPVERYIHALTSRQLCNSATGAVEGCPESNLFVNPLFSAEGLRARTSSDVMLVGILGVPWQDIAVSPNPADRLTYRPAVGTETKPGVEWSWLLPSSSTQDPAMRESVAPRTGKNPATGIDLAPPGSPRYSNPINGHEHTNLARDELQYACIFPLPEGQRPCPQNSDANCDCNDADLQAEGNPLCQAEDDSFGATQYFAKAYPGLRELQVLNGVGDAAVVASICAKEMSDANALDYGYRPAMQAIVDKVKTKLTDLCFGRQLSTDAEGVTSCRVIELQPEAASCNCAGTRLTPDAVVLNSVRDELFQQGVCKTKADCDEICGCEIAQVPAGPNSALSSCQSEAHSSDNGWCYVDASKGAASAQLVASCSNQAKQSVRFVGDGVPLESSITFLACQGSTYSDEP